MPRIDQVKSGPRAATVALPARLDMNGAAALAETLRGMVDTDVALDAAATRHFGALGVQTIHAAAIAWAAAGRRVSLGGVCDAALDQLSLLGFTPETLIAGGEA